MKESKRLIKNTGIIAIGNMSTRLISFLLLPLYTSILTKSEYGIQDYISTIVLFCVPIITLLLDEGMFRFLIDCKTDEEKKNIISASAMMILGGLACFFVVAVPILLFIRYEYTVYFLLYVVCIVLSTMFNALLRGIGRYDKFAIYNFLTSLVTILLNILFIAVLRKGVHGMLTASIISHLAVTGVFVITEKLWKYIDLKIKDKKQAIDMVKYSLPLIPNKLSWTIINSLNRILIMNVIGSEASGLYAVSSKFPNLMDTVYGFFYQSWKESSARAMKDDSAEAFYNSVYDYLKSFMFAVVVGMTAFMPLIFFFLINKSFNEAIAYVPILLLAMYFSNISGFYGGIFTAYKDTKIMGITTVVAAVINIIVNIALIWKFGLYAAAFSTLISNFVVYIYRRIKVKDYIVLEENHKKTAIGIICMLVVWGLFYSGNVMCQCIGGAVSVVYAVAININLLKVIFGMLKKKRK